MKIRTVFFWSHLAAGVLVGMIILFLSVTGVIVMYEHQIVDAFAKKVSVASPVEREPLSVDEIASIAQPLSAGAPLIMLDYENRETAPVIVHPIGGEEFTLNPFTGEVFDSSALNIQRFFETIVEWHRWLGMHGDGRALGRTITGASNFLFLFLIVTGIYLWVPKVWKWTFFRMNMVFRGGLPTSKARDYNWHHVFGFWALIPLFFIALSGVVISYPWANAAFYRAFGEEPPKQAGPPIIADLQKDAAMSVPAADISKLSSLQDAFDAAKATDENWTNIYFMVPPKPGVPIVRVMVNTGDGVLPKQRTTVVYDRRDGRIAAIDGYEDMTQVEKARMWIRFVHTGEQYGLIGSTIAGLASLAACFLVYTGIALAYRRLVLPALKHRRGRNGQ